MATSENDAPRHAESATGAISAVLCVARGSLHLGVGLAAIALEMLHGLATDGMRRGEAIERRGWETFIAFEREHVAMMKDYLKRSSADRDEPSNEPTREQALASFDVPAREDVRDRINRLQSV